MTLTSTDYYRTNRETRRVIYNCPHCDYETTNTQTQITNHINSRHVCEERRPYQCEYCARGFSQKAHRASHYNKVHNIETAKRKIVSIAYIISVCNKRAKSKNTAARQIYYKNHLVIRSHELNNTLHEYLPGIYLKQHDIHYDHKNKFICLHKCPLWQNC